MTRSGADPRLLETGDPRTDTAAYRRCLGQFATGVAVITTRSGEQPAAIGTFPGITVAELEARLFVGANVAESTVSHLVALGLVTPSRPDLHMTDRGDARLGTLLDRTRRIEEERLAGIPAQDLATTRRVLASIIERGPTR